MTYRPTRRKFLQTTLAVGATLGAPAILRGASPNARLNLAFIGVGGRGASNLKALTDQKLVEVHVAALCDVNGQSLAQVSRKYPQARTYADFRKLYDELGDVDAVVVSTTEHTHAFATLPALQLGKHVYCEKPLAHNIRETRQVTEAAAQAQVATQMGTQIHGMPNYRRVVELVQSGAIGAVREAHVWVGRAWGLQSEEEARAHKDLVYVADRPLEAMTPPDYLDWNLWIGPAPWRPYHDVYFPGPKWYRWWDFGSGTMSDLGSHWNDLPFWALQLDAPRTVEASGPPPHPEIAPASMTVVYEYGPRGDLPPCTVSWYQGTHRPQIWKDGGIPQQDSGILFVGDRGMILADYFRHVLLPAEDFKDFQPPAPFIPDSPGQHEEWLLACVNGTPTGSPFSYAGPLTEANHLGNVAYRVGRKLEWDPRQLRAVDCPEADQYIRREPRPGWTMR